QLHLGDHRHAAAARVDEQWPVSRHPRRQHDAVDPRRQRRRLAAAHHLDAAAPQEGRRGAAREAEPVDEHAVPGSVGPGGIHDRSHLSFKVESDTSEKSSAMIQKRTMTLGSAHPTSSKWWCSGDMRKTRLPVSLKEATCTITDSASSTNRPPTSTSSSSCLHSTATVPMAPPSASDPTSPMNISAGWALNQRKPRLAPASAVQKIVTSAAC